MILSASRRTDIPAFYLDWFFNRLNEGYVLVRNPMNYFQVSKVNLNKDLIDCIVFWTKDPTNILNRLNELEGYNYYFQITINPYGRDIERNVDKGRVIYSFKKLSKKIGKEKTIWRYDPVIFTEDMDLDYHIDVFEKLCKELSGYTEKCVIGFLDLYVKTKKNMKDINLLQLKSEKIIDTTKELNKVANRHNIKLESCSEEIDFSDMGIERSKCIDDKLISRIIGEEIYIEKDKNQRPICGCVNSIDIGMYNTCNHACLYCYANYSDDVVKNSILRHDKYSPFLIGNYTKEDKISERKVVSYRSRVKQLKMF